MTEQTIQPYGVEDFKKVFIWTGRVIHLLDKSKKEDTERPPALCGSHPLWPGIWLTGEMDESFVARINGLPICLLCEKRRGFLENAGSECSQEANC